MKHCAALLLVVGCMSPKPHEAAPEPLPTVPLPPPPESVEGTYELDPARSEASMRVALVFEESGAVKRTKQTAYMRRPEEARGHWKKEGDTLVFTIETEETTCTRRSDELVCGRNVFRRVQR